jgi:penicillin-insensitive murein endopeptidase
MAMPRWPLLLLALLPASAFGLDRTLPKEFLRYPFTVQSLSVGYPNAGFQVRAKLLRESPLLQIKAGSEAHAYGHPALVLMLGRTARQMDRAVPGSRMLVGDLSREHGGRLYGHFSHQSGRDADIGFYARDAQGKPVDLDRFVSFDGTGRALNRSGLVFDDYRNWLLVQSLVRDERAGLSHIFVSRPLRARLLRFAAGRADFRPYVAEAARLLKQPEHADPHDDHFHVRIACPDGQLGPCKNESKRGH